MNQTAKHNTLTRDQALLVSSPPEEHPQEITMEEVETAQQDPNHMNEMDVHPNYEAARSLPDRFDTGLPGDRTNPLPDLDLPGEESSPEISQDEVDEALQDPNYQQED